MSQKFGQRVKSLPYLYCVEKFRLTLEKVVLLIAENSINLSYRKAAKAQKMQYLCGFGKFCTYRILS